MNNFELTHDAKTILMLCGRFHKGATQESEKPLNLREYNCLANWMQDYGIRPSTLLTETGMQMLEKTTQNIEPTRIKRLLSRGPSMAFAIEKWANAGVWVVCRSDAHYPKRLKQHLRKQAPPILYGIGDIQLLDGGGLAIVGSRNVDAEGETFTRKVAQACARQNIQIVSGRARGVDQFAMLAALDAGGSVVGVLAESLLKNALSKRYRDPIREKRLVLATVYSPDAGFSIGSAMGRNKQIYALADFALIISAEKGKGGTWAGATEEFKRDRPRPVFVRTGNNTPQGNRALRDIGAQPFPDPPWDERLAERLSKIPVALKKVVRIQQKLFGDPA